jgi:hypothetical protein
MQDSNRGVHQLQFQENSYTVCGRTTLVGVVQGVRGRSVRVGWTCGRAKL